MKKKKLISRERDKKIFAQVKMSDKDSSFPERWKITPTLINKKGKKS